MHLFFSVLIARGMLLHINRHGSVNRILQVYTNNDHYTNIVKFIMKVLKFYALLDTINDKHLLKQILRIFLSAP